MVAARTRALVRLPCRPAARGGIEDAARAHRMEHTPWRFLGGHFATRLIATQLAAGYAEPESLGLRPSKDAPTTDVSIATIHLNPPDDLQRHRFALRSRNQRSTSGD